MKHYNHELSMSTHSVQVWLHQDEALYRLARRELRYAKTRAEAAEHIRDHLHECGLYETPDGAKYSKTAIRKALVGL